MSESTESFLESTFSKILQQINIILTVSINDLTKVISTTSQLVNTNQQ